MPIKIGFALITYNEPERLLRLVNTLNSMFSSPPIVCHHDFSQCPLDEALFPPNVRFVHPHITTGWCHINTPLSVLKAFSLLREKDRPDWYVLLSGSDYPVRPAAEIEAELSNSTYDAYLDNREILYRAVPTGQTAQSGYGRPSWISLAYDRYCAIRCFWLPLPSRKLLASGNFSLHRKYFYIRNPHLLRRIQSDRPSRIYGGAFWIQANQKAVDILLDDPSTEELVRYFGERLVPEESLFQTVLCNRPELRICKDHKRYEDWSEGGSHPKWLEESDVPKIRASGAHFARKVRSDGVVQDLIDQTLLGISS
jgi:hypothetical protein